MLHVTVGERAVLNFRRLLKDLSALPNKGGN